MYVPFSLCNGRQCMSRPDSCARDLAASERYRFQTKLQPSALTRHLIFIRKMPRVNSPRSRALENRLNGVLRSADHQMLAQDDPEVGCVSTSWHQVRQPVARPVWASIYLLATPSEIANAIFTGRGSVRHGRSQVDQADLSFLPRFSTRM